MWPMKKAAIEIKSTASEFKESPVNEVKSNLSKKEQKAKREDDGFIVLEHWDRCS